MMEFERARRAPAACALIVMTLLGPAVALADELPSTATNPESLDAASLPMLDIDAKAWLVRRHEQAAADKREIVQIPGVTRSLGWGCECPEYYVGSDSSTFSSLLWLNPTGAYLPSMSEYGSTYELVGYFVGTTTELDLRDASGEPEGWLYTLYDFEVLQVLPTRYEDDPQMQILLAGAIAETPAVDLDPARPWFVIAASIPASNPKAQKKAEKALTELKDAGFEGEIIPSWQTDRLACCFLSVVGGRFATEDEAEARAEAVVAKGLKAYVKSAFD